MTVILHQEQIKRSGHETNDFPFAVGMIFLESKFNNVVLPDPLFPINPILSVFFT